MVKQALGILGRSKMVCPYYATRNAVKDADILLVPYSSLLSQQTKEVKQPLRNSLLLKRRLTCQSLGIKMEGNVLIVDEAHNLMDAINSAHRAILTGHASSNTFRYYYHVQSCRWPRIWRCWKCTFSVFRRA